MVFIDALPVDKAYEIVSPDAFDSYLTLTLRLLSDFRSSTALREYLHSKKCEELWVNELMPENYPPYAEFVQKTMEFIEKINRVLPVFQLPTTGGPLFNALAEVTSLLEVYFGQVHRSQRAGSVPPNERTIFSKTSFEDLLRSFWQGTGRTATIFPVPSLL